MPRHSSVEAPGRPNRRKLKLYHNVPLRRTAGTLNFWPLQASATATFAPTFVAHFRCSTRLQLKLQFPKPKTCATAPMPQVSCPRCEGTKEMQCPNCMGLGERS